MAPPAPRSGRNAGDPGGRTGRVRLRRLVWQACEVCRLGLIVKIRGTGPWQRHGYGSRMVRLALRGRDGSAWTTTPQSEDARAFIPAITASTGVTFPRQGHLCEHMQAREPQHSRPAQQLDSPPS
ncbi:hypothetical protein ACIG63_06095 [Streptomyces antimycoticus]|uniref:hypothetical protein n=1 Tax=Streptomyces antimycoticus TaxID=68175 RepID=UPI0037D7A5E4